jgi:hypothetical protein
MTVIRGDSSVTDWTQYDLGDQGSISGKKIFLSWSRIKTLSEWTAHHKFNRHSEVFAGSIARRFIQPAVNFEQEEQFFWITLPNSFWLDNPLSVS